MLEKVLIRAGFWRNTTTNPRSVLSLEQHRLLKLKLALQVDPVSSRLKRFCCNSPLLSSVVQRTISGCTIMTVPPLREAVGERKQREQTKEESTMSRLRRSLL